ncbi:MAG: hypothetical protein KAX65_00055 [Caldilineaceae bacterium]|nr:hypothetical protein [Caldilineaceae bacterium]
MKSRCNNPNSTGYELYGGRGITVCERWQNSFENFYADMGERPIGKTLDRIDCERGYSPKNCRWATPKEQAVNQIGFRDGVREYTAAEIADWCNRPIDAIRRVARDNPGIGFKRGGEWVFSRDDRKKIVAEFRAAQARADAEHMRKMMERFPPPPRRAPRKDKGIPKPRPRKRRAKPAPAQEAQG